MDTITHTLFGLTLYGTVDKQKMEKNTKKALLFTSVAGSLIPDIDVFSQLWDTAGMYQMWHRGITHSVFLVPFWALLLWLVCWLLWKTKDRRLFYIGLFAVFIHNTTDLFNAWGTGYLEPFSSVRITFGTIPIVDLVFWTIMAASFSFVKYRHKLRFDRLKRVPAHTVFRVAWIWIAAHIIVQSIQGYYIYQQVAEEYEQHALSASFLPWNFMVIGKKNGQVELSHATILQGARLHETIETAEGTDLEQLFEQNPRARTLYEWSPFVVIVDNEEILGVYDPRFYQNGQSFLFEFIEKATE